MTIRDWEEKDIFAVSEIERAIFSQPRSENEFALEYKSEIAHYGVADESEEILGYGGYYFVLDEGYVTNIAVRKDARRQGIGRELVGFLLESAKKRGLSFLSLEVRKSNLGAIALYERAGFVLQGERKGFYEAPVEDALIYTCFLEEK